MPGRRSAIEKADVWLSTGARSGFKRCQGVHHDLLDRPCIRNRPGNGSGMQAPPGRQAATCCRGQRYPCPSRGNQEFWPPGKFGPCGFTRADQQLPDAEAAGNDGRQATGGSHGFDKAVPQNRWDFERIDGNAAFHEDRVRAPGPQVHGGIRIRDAVAVAVICDRPQSGGAVVAVPAHGSLDLIGAWPDLPSVTHVVDGGLTDLSEDPAGLRMR